MRDSHVIADVLIIVKLLAYPGTHIYDINVNPRHVYSFDLTSPSTHAPVTNSKNIRSMN